MLIKMTSAHRPMALLLALTISSALAPPAAFAQNTLSNKPKKELPITLKALTPTIDTRVPASEKRLDGFIQDTYNPEVAAIKKSDFSSAYEAGLSLFKDGDYNRAFNAFNLAKLYASEHGAGDPRVQQAQKAIDSARTNMTLASNLGIKLQGNNQTSLTGTIEKVFPPSLAWLSGLKAGDKIVKSLKGGSQVTLTVQRGKKSYQLALAVPKAPSTSLSGGASASAGGPIAHPELLEKAGAMLRNYDCYLLVDISGSMGSRLDDSSGGRFHPTVSQYPSGTSGTASAPTTKWEWCRQQVIAFQRELSAVSASGITVLPFNHNFSEVPNCNAAQLSSLFSQLAPSGGTNMAEPLTYVIMSYLERISHRQKTKPIAIAVMTDGEAPLQPIAELINYATERISRQSQIAVTFLTIGSTTFGAEPLEELDDNMVAAGARFDIVDTRSFEELKRYGLMKCLGAALIEKKAEGGAAK